jgi:hypothetical protein
MAVIHPAQLTPTKLEALSDWLPRQPWSGVAAGAELLQVGRFRFDDPAGEVGVETMLVRVGEGPVLQAPLTYRPAPLEGAEEFLVTTMDHSVLGPRWVYDAVGDPVYADVLHRAIVTGGTEADIQLAVDGRFEPGPKHATARGSGSASDAPTITSVQVATVGAVTTITTAAGDLVVQRVPGGDVPAGETLTASWGEDRSAVLAVATS